MSRKEWSLLFSELDLRSVLTNQATTEKNLVEQLPESQIIDDNVDGVVQSLKTEAMLARLEFHVEDISIDSEETKVDARYLPDRCIRDSSRPFYIDALRVIYFVFFKGDAAFLRCRPSQLR